MLNSKNLIIFSSITIVFLIVANVGVSGSYSTTGEVLRDLSIKKQELVESNRRLKHQLLTKTSLIRLEKEAQHLGFSQPDQIISVRKNSDAVALSQPN